jgi:hypothetical protein
VQIDPNTKDAFNLTELLSSYLLTDDGHPALVCRPRMVNIVLNQLLDWICNEQRCVSWYTRMKSKKKNLMLAN